jgi:hypothetical protein
MIHAAKLPAVNIVLNQAVSLVEGGYEKLVGCKKI